MGIPLNERAEPPLTPQGTASAEPLPLPDDEPLPVPDDEPNPLPRSRAVKPPPRRRWATIAACAVVGFLALGAYGVGGFFTIRALVQRERPPANGPELTGAPTLPPAQPEPTSGPTENPVPPPEPTEPAPAGPILVAPQTPTPPVKLVSPATLQLPGAVTSVHAGGGGRYLLFHVPARRQLVTYDVVAGQTVGTIPADPGALIAVGREKVFLAHSSDGRLYRFDIRTGVLEGVSAPLTPERFLRLAIGSGAGGPLVLVSQAEGRPVQVQLFEPDTFTLLRYPIDDPDSPARSFPLALPTGTASLGVSADGRAIAVGDRLYTRTANGYRACAINPSSSLVPTADGKLVVGSALVGETGQVFQYGDRLLRAFLPTTGPFFLSVEYGGGKSGRAISVKLHADQEPGAFAELPCTAAVQEWVNQNGASSSELRHHLMFIPDPGLMVFAPFKGTTALLFRIDLGALLPLWREVMFTSVPSAAIPAKGSYTYQSSATARDGAAPAFSLQAGPPGMTVTPDGRLTWAPTPAQRQRPADVRLVARTGTGKQAVQRFTLLPPSEQERDLAANPPTPVPLPVATVPAPKRPAPAVPPVTSPPPGAATLVRPKTIPLPAAATSVAVGGGGRYFCLFIPLTGQVAVFDATQGQITKTLAVGKGALRIAAGAEKLFVVDPREKVVQRWDLTTFEKELTAPLPDKFVAERALIGSAATGPLWLFGTGAAALDTQTLQRIELKADNWEWDRRTHHRVSADGRVLGTPAANGRSGMSLATLVDQTLRVRSAPNPAGFVAPGPDGRIAYTLFGRFAPDGRAVGADGASDLAQPSLCIPPAEGSSLFLRIPPPPLMPFNNAPRGLLQVLRSEDGRTLAELPIGPGAGPPGGNYAIAPDQRFLLVPSADLIVELAESGDRLLLHPFELDKALARLGEDYLFVDGPPSAAAVRGRAFSLGLTIRSKLGGVKVKLEAAPDGLKATPDGKIAWTVPEHFPDTEAIVVLTVSDASGREALHTLRLTVRGGQPAPAAGAKVAEVKLSGMVEDVVVGAGGRLLILHVSQKGQLEVFDAVQGKVVKTLPMSEGGIGLAAGRSHLFVANPAARTLDRYSLKTYEKEATSPLPIPGAVAGLCMGSASDGPLLICPKGDSNGTGPVLVDALTLKPIPGGDRLPPVAARFARASADGSVFTWRNEVGHEGHNMTFVEVADGRAKSRTFGEGSSLLLPAPDGRYVYTGWGVHDGLFQRLHPTNGTNSPDRPFLPASSRGVFVQLEPLTEGRDTGGTSSLPRRGRVNFFLPGQHRAFASIDGIDGLAGEHYHNGHIGGWLMHDKRVHLLPAAGRLITIPAANDTLHVYRYDLDELLTRSRTDYLLFASAPPTEAGRGSVLGYAPVVRSRTGAVKVRLDSGPDGMTFLDGRLAWKVPADFAEREVNVLLAATDASGQEVFQGFRLAVRARTAGDADSRPEPVSPKLANGPAPAPTPIGPPATVGPIRPTPLKANWREVKLPGAVTDLCLGGGGRFVIYRLASVGLLAVFDVNEGKVVKYLPVGAGEVKFAAGLDALFVLDPGPRLLHRWSLATLERETTVPLVLGGNVTALLLGHASRGPLFAAVGPDPQFGKPPSVFLDPLTLQPINTKVPESQMSAAQARISADGSLAVGRDLGHGSVTLSLRTGVRSESPDRADAAFIGGPSADGRFLYGNGIWTHALKPVEGAERRLYLPAAEGPFFFSGRPKANGHPDRLDLFIAGRTRPFATADLPTPGLLPPADPQPGGTRLIWVPAADLLVGVPPGDDRLILARVGLDDLLKNSPDDYVAVLSAPPSEAVRGGRFDYSVDARAKAGTPTVRLTSGPAGMTVVGSRVTWEVPKNFADTDTAVVLSVTDGKGQETFQSFTLAVRDTAPGAGRGPRQPASDAPAKTAEPTAPPGNLALQTAPLDRDEQVVNLPSTAGPIVPAAGGRLLIVHLPKDRALAVFDTAAARVVKYLPVPDDEVKFAAGRDELLVLLPETNVLQRWDLKALKRQSSVTSPLPGPVKALAMGSNSTGPLVVTTRSKDSAGILLYDLKTLKRSDRTFAEGVHNGRFSAEYQPEVRISADGDVITGWVSGLQPSGVYVWTRTGKTYEAFHEHDTWGPLLPDAGGRTVYANKRAIAPDGTPLPVPPEGTPVPAVQGPLLLSMTTVPHNGMPGARVRVRPTVHPHRGERPLMTLPELTGLDTRNDISEAARAGEFERRVFLIPDAKLLVAVPDAGDRLILHRFDLDALAERSGTDYLYVSGSPPAEVAAGAKFTYAPVVRSKKGGAKFKLVAGPDGMKLGAAGTIEWEAPASATGSTVIATVSVSDSSGQEIAHTFKLSVTPAVSPGP
ncbi:hypothetical protein R5W24_002130 [Gemmata sp. JC717]|uniref:hypothetical protein n=1 Tax=Gemmata algarum TaxID=2975278 RepID=UPI0021BB9443|nr:hypothetical protein [Gemmata algarum]MDY3553040.1 hypothetical protein [Gemmata algarum]